MLSLLGRGVEVRAKVSCFEYAACHMAFLVAFRDSRKGCPGFPNRKCPVRWDNVKAIVLLALMTFMVTMFQSSALSTALSLSGGRISC